jgi:hypothetical protein
MFGVPHAVIRVFSEFWHQLATGSNEQRDLGSVKSW